ncbi:putative mitochondrial protein AtMg00240 [Nicotiana tabacum]|uniref:Mitochondrial protein AtMg00240 n=1 Tax=Nicotiana tabacum TaxID=4097 RepID=A0AC58TDS6_TOBAC
MGNLNFLTPTRPDIYFAVQHLSQFMQKPCIPHMQAALRLLRYLKSTPDFGIFYNNSSDLSLSVYYDSDWGACLDSRKSVGGFCILRGEAVLWVGNQRNNLWCPCPLLKLNIGPRATIHIAKNPVFHKRTKHIELDCHFVRTKLNEGLLQLLHTSSATQLADMEKQLREEKKSQRQRDREVARIAIESQIFR